MAALTVLSDARGYSTLRVDDLIARAGVSRAAFYEQFGGKGDLLLAAVGEIGALAADAVDAACARGGAPVTRLAAAVEALAGFAAAQPAATRLWLLDAYGAGPPAVEAAERGIERVRAAVGAVLEDLAGGGETAASAGADAATAVDPPSATLPAPVPRALVGAVQRTIAARLRQRREDELAALAGPLATWLASYRPPPVALRRPRGAATATDARFTPRDQAERILLGLCEAVYEKGYEATTLADVAARAQTSIRTFYAHYEGKQEAFVDAVDLAQVQSSAAALAAGRRAPDWPHAVRNALSAICGYYAIEPTLAETAIVEVYAAGEVALSRHDEAIAAIGDLLEPGFELAPDTPPIATEAIGGAVDALLYDAIRAGGGPKLRAVAPTATFIALSPFLGPATACAVANDSGQPRRRQA